MNKALRIEMVDPEKLILEEIADPKITRNSVALTYAFCLRQGWGTAIGREVNRAIIDRWSLSALDYIKKRAWGIYEGRIQP